MKKLLTLLLLAFMVSCSSEDAAVDSVNLQSDESTLQDGILTFKDEKSFIGEYSKLSKMNPSELQKWISAKKVNSLLNTSNDSLVMQEEVLSQSRIIYSDAMKAILNNESKVKIGEKVLWLEENKFYLLTENDLNKTTVELKSRKNKLENFGKVISLSNLNKNLSSREVIPNENRIKTFVTGEQTLAGSRLRLVVDLFNETVVFNNQILTSKMFLRSTLQYRSCSTFRCTWKQANNERVIGLQNIVCSNCNEYTGFNLVFSNIVNPISGEHTMLIAEWGTRAPAAISYKNFIIDGRYTTSVSAGTTNITTVFFSVDLSWYL